MIQAVIFDMDGVLIDSEPVYLEAQYQNLHRRYPWVTRESMHPTVGMSGQDYPGFMARLCRRREGDPAFQAELDAAYTALHVDYRAILRPQVPAMLQALQDRGLQLALASSSSLANIRQVLRECGLEGFFPCVVSGEQFAQSKPDPEIYRVTMQKLGRQPQECLIVEDSTYGIAAGVASGATVAALQDTRFPFDQTPAHLHIQSLAEVPALAACGGRRIKAAFFDIDGTLISMGGHYLPPSTAAALAALRQKGIAVLLCTGRHALEIEQADLLPGLAFDGGVYMNGALCTLGERVVLENRMPPAALAALRDFLLPRGLSCIFLERDRMYTNLVEPRIIAEQARIGTPVPPVADIGDVDTRAVYQVIPFVTAEEEAALLAAMPGCQALRWGEAVVDIARADGGKEAGLAALCAALGITPEQAIAFGDGENDAAVLRAAGIGVAMGNAGAAARQSADYITDPVEADGVLHALQHFCLV